MGEMSEMSEIIESIGIVYGSIFPGSPSDAVVHRWLSQGAASLQGDPIGVYPCTRTSLHRDHRDDGDSLSTPLRTLHPAFECSEGLRVVSDGEKAEGGAGPVRFPTDEHCVPRMGRARESGRLQSGEAGPSAELYRSQPFLRCP